MIYHLLSEVELLVLYDGLKVLIHEALFLFQYIHQKTFLVRKKF